MMHFDTSVNIFAAVVCRMKSYSIKNRQTDRVFCLKDYYACCSTVVLQTQRSLLFFSRNWGYCLNDKPTPHPEYQSTFALPGSVYDADHQCRLMFGSKSRYCAGVDVSIQQISYGN